MTNTTSNRPELYDIKRPDGEPYYAEPGAVSKQGGSRPVKQCSACGGFVVFVQSTKTGKWYLADCFDKYKGGMYYVKASPHYKTCARVLEQRAEGERREAEKRRELAECDAYVTNLVAFFAAEEAWDAEQKAAGITPTREQRVAKMHELARQHNLTETPKATQ